MYYKNILHRINEIETKYKTIQEDGEIKGG
jgi:hypothetical protein